MGGGEVIALRHVAFEDLGLLGSVLGARGHRVRYVEVPTEGVEALDAHEPALVVVLGGPIGATDDEAYPFLERETALLRARLEGDLPTLGLCLGAQLMARALGAAVFPAPRPEIGWAPVALTEAGRRSPLAALEGVPVLHWHGDTYELPAGAERLASTAVCPDQAFRTGRCLGLQFHAEACGPALEAWLVGHTVEIAGTPGLSVTDLRADTARHTPALAKAGRRVFETWLASVGL